MNGKRILCLLLALALLSTGAFAADALISPAGGQNYEIIQRNAQDPVLVWGNASELGGNSVRLTNDNDQSAYSDIVLKVNEDTVILDAVTGAVKTISDLKKDEILYAYASPAMTRSQPPQSAAVLILCNFPADFGAPSYAQIERVTAREDGGVDVLMRNDVILHLSKDTELLSYKTRNIPTLEDLKPGVMLLSWYQVVALSEPAQATPDKVMVFPGTYDGYLSAAPGALSVNGEAVALTDAEKPFVRDGKLMVPVRKTAEALGCKVEWDGASRTVRVTKDGAARYDVALQSGTAVLEGDMVYDLTLPAVLKNGVTFLAAEDLLVYHNVKLAAG